MGSGQVTWMTRTISRFAHFLVGKNSKTFSEVLKAIEFDLHQLCGSGDCGIAGRACFGLQIQGAG